jgi:menaquinone biosynthesis decarboxylase
MHTNLRDFINTLRKEKEVAEVTAQVDPYLEVAEIHRRVIEEKGPALLFTNVKGSAFPIVTNLFGTERRVNLAFGPRPENLMKQIIGAMDRLMPPTPKALWSERGMIQDLLKVGIKKVGRSRAPILECLQSPAALHEIPAITSWQKDGGPFITLPLVYTEHPETKHHNLGMYRIQIYGSQTTGMHWQIHKGGGFHYHEAEKRNRSLPVTVFVGGPPALIASAIAPVPEPLPELLLASLILGKKLNMVEDPRSQQQLVAEAEFALCGHVPPHERRMEGPFGDHYGYYSWEHEFPVFHVDHVWHRKDAIYPATVVGKPRQEDYYLGEFLQRLLSPAFPMAMPGVKDLWTYAETGFHPLAAAVVRESYAREAVSAAFRILGEGQLTLTKFLIITDQSPDLSDFAGLMQTVLERFRPERDLIVLGNTSMDTLDYTGRQLNHGSKAIMMGVGEAVRELPGQYEGGRMAEVRQVEVFCPGCLVISGASYEDEPELACRILTNEKSQLSNWPLVFLVDDASVAKGQTSFLWTTFTRFNPAHDIYADAKSIRHHLSYEFPIIIDARMKPGYPDELFPQEDIANRVSSRWKEYFAR